MYVLLSATHFNSIASYSSITVPMIACAVCITAWATMQVIGGDDDACGDDAGGGRGVCVSEGVHSGRNTRGGNTRGGNASGGNARGENDRERGIKHAWSIGARILGVQLTTAALLVGGAATTLHTMTTPPTTYPPTHNTKHAHSTLQPRWQLESMGPLCALVLAAPAGVFPSVLLVLVLCCRGWVEAAMYLMLSYNGVGVPGGDVPGGVSDQQESVSGWMVRPASLARWMMMTTAVVLAHHAGAAVCGGMVGGSTHEEDEVGSTHEENKEDKEDEDRRISTTKNRCMYAHRALYACVLCVVLITSAVSCSWGWGVVLGTVVLPFCFSNTPTV